MLLEAFILNNRESVFQKITCEKAVRAEKIRSSLPQVIFFPPVMFKKGNAACRQGFGEERRTQPRAGCLLCSQLFQPSKGPASTFLPAGIRIRLFLRKEFALRKLKGVQHG